MAFAILRSCLPYLIPHTNTSTHLSYTAYTKAQPTKTVSKHCRLAMGGGHSFPTSVASYSSHSNSQPISQKSTINEQNLYVIGASYCPNLALSFLDENTLQKSVSYSLQGACLLADICGFTKFSGALSQEGVSGIDKLRRITSSFLTKFIDIVYYYSGDVIAFAGDALICYFGPIKEDLNDMTQCCLRAIHCGNELKLLQTNTLLAHIAIDYGYSRLAFVGGYQDQWTYLFDGECFSTLSNCVSDAGNQELVISSNLFKQIQHNSSEKFDHLIFKQLPSGNYLVDDSDLKPFEESQPFLKSLIDEGLRAQVIKSGFHSNSKQILSFVPKPVLNIIQQQQQQGDDGSLSVHTLNTSSLSELRRVSCLFLKLDSYTYQFPLHDLQHCYQSWQEIVFRHGGYIRQFVVDDKGCVLIALWGVPTASHVNDAIRALSAASELSIFCSTFGYTVSMGVTTGDVYCGLIGCNLRSDYAAVGPSINLSARLMSKSKGRIYLDEQTNYFLDSWTQNCSLKLPLMSLKGSTNPVQVYQLLGDEFYTASTSPRPMKPKFSSYISFLDSETVDKLDLAISSLKRWYGVIHLVDDLAHLYGNQDDEENILKVILVSGTTGTGKTEVAKQLKRMCDHQRIQNIFIPLNDLDFRNEYGIIRQIFTKLIGEENFSDAMMQTEIITKLFFQTFDSNEDTSLLKQKFESIKEVLGLDWIPLELTTRSNGVNFRQQISSLFRSKSSINEVNFYLQDTTSTFVEFFMTTISSLSSSSSSTSPICILLDECQHCDSASWAIIFNMLNHLRAPILFLFTMTQSKQSTFLADPFSDTPTNHPRPRPSVKFLSFDILNNQIRQRKKSRNLSISAANLLVSQLDPLGGDSDSDGFHCLNQVLDNLKYTNTSHYFSIQLTGLSQTQVKTILGSYIQHNYLTSNLVNIVTEICEGNAYWCKTLGEFIVEFGEETFYKTFCSNDFRRIHSSPSMSSSIISSSPVPTRFPFSRSNSSKRISTSEFTSSPVPSLLITQVSASNDNTGSSNYLSPFDDNYLQDYDGDEIEKETNSTNAADTVLYHLITSLMDRCLTFQQRELLKYSSICGVKFHSDLLRQIMPPSLASQSDQILSSLKQKKFLSSCHGLMNYSFVSYRMRDIIYGLIPCSDASRIHSLVGQHLEKLYRHCLDAFYEVLAFHFTMATIHHFAQSSDEQDDIPLSPSRQPNSGLLPDSESIILKKSYEYSFRSAKRLFAIEQYHKALDYLQYAACEEAMTHLGDGYRQEVIKFLRKWKTSCQQWPTIEQSQRISSSYSTKRYEGLMDTLDTISDLIHSVI